VQTRPSGQAWRARSAVEYDDNQALTSIRLLSAIGIAYVLLDWVLKSQHETALLILPAIPLLIGAHNL
jgi:hypothetical protein